MVRDENKLQRLCNFNMGKRENKMEINKFSLLSQTEKENLTYKNIGIIG